MMTADRDLNKLTPNFQNKVEAFLLEVGDRIFITEGYRSQERQNYLYSLGRSSPGNIVTWTLKSNHTSREAIDIAFKGAELYPKDHTKWTEIAEIAKKYGMDWGFELWGVDKSHLQDNGNPYLPPNTEPMTEFNTYLGIRYPKTYKGVPIKRGTTKRKGLVAMYRIKAQTIWITQNWFKYDEVKRESQLIHEFAHHIHKTKFNKKSIAKWKQISEAIEEYVNNYAKTNEYEDFAEIIEQHFLYEQGHEKALDFDKFNKLLKLKTDFALDLYEAYS